MRQISAETFHSRQVISEVLKASGVRLRAQGQGHGNPSQLKFGYRKEAGKVVPHMGEQQVISAIRDLRAEGMTLRQIAQRMTVLRIPSKNGKLKWHPMMVQRIIEADNNKIFLS
ncbi:MAG: recombinase family protein [Candidatus Caldatribacteriota bacterium]